jgi:acetone carboxylase gamma subunit
MTEWRPALRLVGSGSERQFACGHCHGELAPVQMNWKETAVGRWSDLAESLARLGVRIKARTERRLLLYEWACPHCGSLLETNLYPEGMPPLHDLRVGATSGEELAQARSV